MSKIKKLKNFYNKKKVLITGHTGFVGSWMSLLMIRLGCEVYGISKKNDVNSINYKLLDISKSFKKEFFLDINDEKLLEEKIRYIKPNIIFHLAAQAYVLKSYENPINTFKTNIIGTANVLNASLKNKIQYNVIITTDKCYVNDDKIKNFSEKSKLGGDDPYSASKACAEIITNSLSKSFSKKKIYIDTVRAGNIIGGGDFGYKRLLTDIILSIKKNKNISLRYPNAIRPWQNILDVIFAYSLIPQNQANRNYNFDSWNIGPSKNEKKITVLSVVNKFFKLFNKKRKIIIKKSRIKEKKVLILNSNKIRKKIGWKNQFSINETINQTVNWYKYYFLNDKKNLREYSKNLINKILKF